MEKKEKDYAATLESIKAAENSDQAVINYAFHKMGDGFMDDEMVKDGADSDFMFVLRNEDNDMHAFLYSSWEEIEEFMEENPDFIEVFYTDYDTCASQKAMELVENSWPTDESSVNEAVEATINNTVEDLIGDATYPEIEINFYYNGNIFQTFSL